MQIGGVAVVGIHVGRNNRKASSNRSSFPHSLWLPAPLAPSISRTASFLAFQICSTDSLRSRM